MEEKIRVSIRLRPAANGCSVWETVDDALHAIHGGKQTSYTGFCSVLSEVGNLDVYERCVQSDVRRFLNGKSCTVFAYGQTGSGKTHTMLGSGEEEGMVQLAVREVLQSREAGLSYLEIYNERLFDLSSNSEVQMFSVGKKNVVANLWVENVSRWEEAMLFIERCERNRRVGSTEFNARSSRSHIVFRIMYSYDGETRMLSMVDLAGSERASRSSERRAEGAFINRSLLALCTVVNNIGNSRYTGFRDSKLTRLLQQSFDGKVGLVAICMLSPDAKCMEESISTLKFAARLSSLELKICELASTRPAATGGCKQPEILLRGCCERQPAVERHVLQDATGSVTQRCNSVLSHTEDSCDGKPGTMIDEKEDVEIQVGKESRDEDLRENKWPRDRVFDDRILRNRIIDSKLVGTEGRGRWMMREERSRRWRGRRKSRNDEKLQEEDAKEEKRSEQRKGKSRECEHEKSNTFSSCITKDRTLQLVPLISSYLSRSPLSFFFWSSGLSRSSLMSCKNLLPSDHLHTLSVTTNPSSTHPSLFSTNISTHTQIHSSSTISARLPLGSLHPDRSSPKSPSPVASCNAHPSSPGCAANCQEPCPVDASQRPAFQTIFPPPPTTQLSPHPSVLNPELCPLVAKQPPVAAGRVPAEELREIMENRIASLEKMILELLGRTPCSKMKEIFVLEKHMFNLRRGVILRKHGCSEIPHTGKRS